MEINPDYTPEEKREIGKAYFYGDVSREEKNYGLKLIIEAHKEGDPEATYLVARLMLRGVLSIKSGNANEHALTLMCSAANKGCIQARAFLNSYCRLRYEEGYAVNLPKRSDGALVDFDGKPIKIDRQGVFTPVDAVLEYKDGRNILTLSANVVFRYVEEINNAERFERAVFRGLLAWEGDYEVFGGQKLSVRVNLTSEDNLYDNLIIIPLTDELSAKTQALTNIITGKERKTQITDIFNNKRSFASAGLKWSVNSRKIILLQSRNGKFDDYEEIMHVAKHEFGHVLGLGDLYESSVDSLGGVEKGTYAELDSYVIKDKFYNLVMCDYNGPISNNDIEMVVLAYRDNEMQLYQPGKIKGKISSALGKGN